MSQLLKRLERELDATENVRARAELGAKIACELSRVGRFEEAKALIEELKRSFGADSAEITVWRMLAEGLLHFYSDLSPLALDRIGRAQFLAVAMRYSPFIALSSAWKAHIEFELSRYAPMIMSLRTAVEYATDNDLDAQTRIAMVLSNSYMMSGNRSAAHRWFVQGRSYAVRNGDQASVEALLYNRAAFSFALLRTESCVRRLNSDDVRSCRMEIESTKNLQTLTGIKALHNHIFLCDARLSMLENDFETARVKLGEARQQGPFAKYNFDQVLIDLEVAFCNFKTGVDVLPPSGAFGEFASLDIDEQVYAAWLIWQLSQAASTFADPKEAESRFLSLLGQYQGSCNDLARRLDGANFA